MTFGLRHSNAIFEGKIAQLCALVKSRIFIVGNSNFEIVYFKRYIFILCGNIFRFIGTLRRDCDQLLITYNKPHRAASSDTIGRWLKTVMTKSGIDTQQFGAHSTRAAVASPPFSKKVSVDHLNCSWLVECSNFWSLLQQATSSSGTEFW